MNFHQLINDLSREQKVYQFPHRVSDTRDNIEALDYIFQQIKYRDLKSEFELIPSHKKENSILISMINVLFQYPLHMFDQYLVQLKDYIMHWMIVYHDIMKSYKLNEAKLSSTLADGLDHEDQILLLALIFKINIVVIDLNRQFRLYSPIDIGNVYVILFQHSNLKYSAVKFRPSKKEALSNIIGFMSIVEGDHPLIAALLENLT